MKTRFIRKIDRLGRITLPMEFRKSLGLTAYERANFELVATDEGILIKPFKSNHVCQCCDEYATKLITYKDFKLCNACVNEIIKEATYGRR